eukprot:746756-Hanusia_phi.AAC.3
MELLLFSLTSLTCLISSSVREAGSPMLNLSAAGNAPAVPQPSLTSCRSMYNQTLPLFDLASLRNASQMQVGAADVRRGDLRVG